jgi:thiamine transport system permease protein
MKSFRVDEKARALLRVGLAAALISPYLIWLAAIPRWSLPSPEVWATAASASIIQSLMSSVLACAAGFVLFHALQAWRRPSLGEAALLLPNLIPPLFVAMALLSVGGTGFPYGLGAVVTAHVLMNAGLVAVALDRLVRAKAGGLAEVAWTMGCGRRRFWREIGWPVLRADFACIFLFIFSLCLTSFSLPLLLGGSRATSLEVAIYDTIRVQGRWDQAVLLAAGQSLALLALAWLLPQPFWPRRPERGSLPALLTWRGARVAVALPAVILIIGWLIGLGTSVGTRLPAEVTAALPGALMASAALGLTVGFAHLILFLLVAYVSPHARLNRFLNGYLAPSPTITGFGLLLLPLAKVAGPAADGETAMFIKLTAALTLISFPLLYRWLVHGALAGLARQVAVARGLGAGWSAVLFEIVWPQAAPAFLRASGLAAVWACGDFAVSGIFLGRELTLPLVIADLLGNYRFEQAALLLLPLIALALLMYTVFVRASRYVVG